MLLDGIKFVGRPTLSAEAQDGELLYLTQQDGANAPGLYQYSNTAWSKVGSGASLPSLAAVDQDIIPDTDNVRSLGSPTKMWRDAYIGPGSLYVNGQKVIEDSSGTIVLSADTDQNIQVKTSGGGDIEFYPSGSGNIDMKGNLSIQAGKNLMSGDGNPINCTAGFINLNLTGTATAYNLTVSGDLIVSGTTTTINTETINLADNIITLNSNASGTPVENAGVMVERGDLANAQLIWNEADDRWKVSSDGISFKNILIEGDAVGGGSSFSYSVVSANTTMSKDNAYIVSTSSGAYTVTLPSNPSAGDLVKVIDGESNASTNNIIVARNGQPIMSLAEDMIIDINNANVILVYIDGTRGWMIG